MMHTRGVTRPEERGRLTEEWLENVPDYNVKDIRGSMHSIEVKTSIAKVRNVE